MNISENHNVFAKGILRLYDKETGKLIANKNLVVKNSLHITALALGGDINNISITAASWGDNFYERPSQSYYTMEELEAETALKLIESEDTVNNTTKSVNTVGHFYTSQRSLKYTFEINKNNAPELLGKNVIEFGLYMNGMLFSRVALEEDFVFQDWMKINGEWEILLSNVAGGYSNFATNSYEIQSLWTMDSLYEGTQIKDEFLNNTLTGQAATPKLVTNIIDFEGITEDDKNNYDSLPSFYGGTNVFSVTGEMQRNLNLSDKFTLWSWIKINNSEDASSTLSNEQYIDVGTEQVIMSKWKEDGDASDKCYKFYIEKIDETDYAATIVVPDIKYYAKFAFNDDDGSDSFSNIITLSKEINLDMSESFNLTDSWIFVAATLDFDDKRLKFFVNGDNVAETTLSVGGTPENLTDFYIGAAMNDTTYTNPFRGIIDECGISHETFDPSIIKSLWNSGNGDFYRG